MHILAIDQGTTGTTTTLYDKNAHLVRKSYRSFRQIFPRPGWVEHDPMEIWQTVIDTVKEIIDDFPGIISGVGITNQRETTVIWNKKTGIPVYNAIVWQCRRTSVICDQFREHEIMIKHKTGLPLDAYFSGTKVKWLLDNTAGSNMDDLMFGTIDTWLIWKLTSGKTHATDFTNASRTLLFNIYEKKWDEQILQLFGIPASILPEVRKSSDHYGVIEGITELKGIPVTGVAGDQQAALFGQKCFASGQVKNTYGTGCFLLMNTGDQPVISNSGLITTLAVDARGKPCYAIEGSVFIAGALIQWLRDELHIINDSAESEQIALSVADNGDVYLVPAFVGLGAPHWDPDARGTITGLTRGSNRGHLVRAGLESIAYQTYDVLKLMEKDARVQIAELAVDGGATANGFLMQFQSDILNMPIHRPVMAELTSLGAAFLAGLQVGVWENTAELLHLEKEKTVFKPDMSDSVREELLAGWQKAIRQTRLK